MTTEHLDLLCTAIQGASSVLILPHNDPDPDAIASAVALKALLAEESGIGAQIASKGIIGRAENKAPVRGMADAKSALWTSLSFQVIESIRNCADFARVTRLSAKDWSSVRFRQETMQQLYQNASKKTFGSIWLQPPSRGRAVQKERRRGGDAREDGGWARSVHTTLALATCHRRPDGTGPSASRPLPWPPTHR